MANKKTGTRKAKGAGKPLRKNVLREVRSTLSRFVAIFAITALGAGFFAGLRATGPNMKATADEYYAKQHLMDYRLLSTMGFTQDDVNALKARGDVAEVMASQSLDLLVDVPDGEVAARLHALPEDTSAGNPAYLNRLEVLEGRLPEAKTECVVGIDSGYELGDAIQLAQSNEEASLNLMAVREFTVVGLVRSPCYVSYFLGSTTIGSGHLAFFMYVPLAAFDSEYYTELYILQTGLEDLSAFSGAYKNRTESGQETLEAFGEDRAQVRYNDIYAEASEELAAARGELATARSEADQKLAEAWQEIEDGEAALADGRAAIAENEQKLADAEAQIASGEAELTAGRSTLGTKQAEYDAGLAAYNSQKAAYDTQAAQVGALATGVTGVPDMLNVLAALQNTTNPAEIDTFNTTVAVLLQTIDGVAALLDAGGNSGAAGALSAIAAAARTAPDLPTTYAVLATLNDPLLPGTTAGQLMQDTVNAAQNQLAAALPALTAAAAQLAEGKAALDAGWAQLAAGEAQLASARSEVETGRRQLAEARSTLADAAVTLAEGKAEYETQKAEVEQKFADAEAEIADGQKALDELEKPEWIVLTREGNSGYSGFESDTGRIDAIAIVIPVFFFLVAALVCLTTMTRMVEEQRTQIGTMKALGYGKGAIASQYIFYAGMASFSGALAGVLVGALLFPAAIWNAYQILYILPGLRQGDNAALFLSSIGISVLCTTAATLAACYSELRSVPAQLMRPKAPKAGKRVLLERVGPVWRRLSFTQKVTARNLFRYKKRFLMTVIGVAGCSALLLTGFGLRDSISGIVPIQFGEIDLYDVSVSLTEPSTAGADTPVNDLLGQMGDGVYVQQTLVDAKSPSGTNAGMSTYLFVAEDPGKLGDFIDFHQRESGEAVAFPQGNGVLVTEKFANRLHLSAGDTFQLARQNEKMVSVTVAGVVENYVYNYIYITPETYQGLFGTVPEYSMLYIHLTPEAKQDMTATMNTIVNTTGVVGAMEVATLQDQFDDMMSSLDAVVWLIILSAGALAFVVLYNLTNINVTERAREIATLKVLGFYPGEVALYVYRENLLLTIIGIAVGLVGGIFLHRFVITTAEIDEVMFRRVVMPLSYGLAAAFTLASAMLVNLVMLRRLKKIDMVESLKSAE